MITLSMFQNHLSVTAPMLSSTSQSVNDQEYYLLKLLAALPAQAEEQQAEFLEKALTMLRSTDMDDQQRLKLTSAVIDTANQFIATLRQYYIYETGALSEAQLDYVAQIESLYYQFIMVYDGVLRRNRSFLNLDGQQKHLTKSGWKRYFSAEKSSSIMLATAIYQMLLMYQKLLGEDALCYRKPSSYLWSKINQLYHLAHQHHAANIDLSVYITTKRANDIHQLYCQICLHSLLNLRAMRRPNILLVQRLLPEWAKQMVATIEPKTETRVFVDLCSDHPPSYLTAKSGINPYEDHYVCLFIELAPMVEYFKWRKQALAEGSGEGVEYWLLNKIAMTITYRYLQPQLTLTTKHSAKKSAVLITGFNNIHYRASHSSSFTSLMIVKNLPDEQRPRYDTVRKKQDSNSALTIEAIETFDSHDELSLFRTLRLSPMVDNLNAVGKNNEIITTAPPPLHIMSLFLVCRSDDAMPADWSIGVVRWLDLDDESPEVEWQVLGHQLVACGLRLEGGETRSRHFVPAFVLGRDEQLQTLGTLIVPSSYFQSNDRVVMRINNKQTLLRLKRRLLVTDEFSQYEVVQL